MCEYKLVIEFFRPQDACEGWKGRVRKALRKHHECIELEKINEQWHRCTIRGDGSVVDSCHHRIESEVLPEFNLVVAYDDLGDELRKEAYAHLAEIEQGLRRFISRVMLDAVGEDWWEEWCPADVRDTVEEIRQDSGVVPGVEFTYFRHLVDLASWETKDMADGPVEAEVLEEVLDEAEGFDQFKCEIAKRRESRSIWKDIIPRYLCEEDIDAWTGLDTKCLNDVRNKVMHHRPTYKNDLERVVASNGTICDIIERATDTISPEEKKEVSELNRRMGKSFQSIHSKFSGLRSDLMANLAESVQPVRIATPPVLEAFKSIEETHAAFSAKLVGEIARTAEAMQTDAIANLIRRTDALRDMASWGVGTEGTHGEDAAELQDKDKDTDEMPDELLEDSPPD